MKSDHTKTVERFFKAITDADARGMLGLLHPEVEWLVPQAAAPPFGGRHRGAEHIVNMMLSAVKATFVPGSMVHRIRMQMSDANRTVVETNMTARQADGRQYDNTYVFIFEFRDGRISEIREHLDTAYALQFFGAGHDSGKTA